MSETFNPLLAELVQDLNRPRTLEIDEVLSRVVAFTVEAFGAADASISTTRGGAIDQVEATILATSPEVARADDLQHEVGEGPAIDAVAGDKVAASTDLTADQRWPAWRETAVSLGFGAVISVRLRAREREIGTLNLYGRTAGSLTASDASTIELLAPHVAAVVAAAIDQTTLREALDSRGVIGRAQGMIMERYHVDDDRAFALLKRLSQHTNVKLREVAERIVAGGMIDEIDPTYAEG